MHSIESIYTMEIGDDNSRFLMIEGREYHQEEQKKLGRFFVHYYKDGFGNSCEESIYFENKKIHGFLKFFGLTSVYRTDISIRFEKDNLDGNDNNYTAEFALYGSGQLLTKNQALNPNRFSYE